MAQYLGSFDLEWGKFKARTKPSPGNDEWKTPNAGGYREYFGSAFLTDGGTWYSFNVGAWHLVSLDSTCGLNGGCGSSSEQYAWLEADLSADSHACSLAFFHHPRFSSGTTHGSYVPVAPFWDLLQADGTEIVLNGHEHHYERFAPQLPTGVASPSGIRQLVVGTSGHCCYPFGTPLATSEVRITGKRGILELTLGPASYSGGSSRWVEAWQTRVAATAIDCVGQASSLPRPSHNSCKRLRILILIGSYPGPIARLSSCKGSVPRS